MSHHQLRRPVQSYVQLSNYHELLDRITELRRDGHTLSETAKRLNLEGFHSASQAPFTGKLLRNLLRQRANTCSGELKANLKADEYWTGDLANQLTIPTATIRQWRKAGWIHARKVSGRWVLWADAEELDRLSRLRAQRRGWPKPYPNELTTPKPRHQE